MYDFSFKAAILNYATLLNYGEIRVFRDNFVYSKPSTLVKYFKVVNYTPSKNQLPTFSFSF